MRSDRPLSSGRPGRVRIGPIWLDALTFDETLDEIERRAVSGEGGAVFTPNVDHMVNLARSASFRAAYERASLALVDGQALLWASKLLGTGLPEKISGSDLVPRLLERAGRRGLRVYFLGGGPGIALEAAEVARRRYGASIVGVDSPLVSRTGEATDDVVERIRAARPHLLFVALGAPKQELFIDRYRERLLPVVSLGIGASLDFVAGRVRRAPAWVSRAGLEWLFRLSQDPKRLARRYLVDDPRFAGIFLRTLVVPRSERLQMRKSP
jgi:N-acetylglucosaminyldiphosphoundecaprenol N-acetyl-beta-D-mannosaminyltransferase